MPTSKHRHLHLGEDPFPHPTQETQGHPEGILRHHKKCCHAGSQDLVMSSGHHCRDNHHNRADRHNREHRAHAFDLSTEDLYDHAGGGDRGIKDHLNDRHKHRRRINREPLDSQRHTSKPGSRQAQAKVVQEVTVTESAMSPRARKVTTFDAVPPGTHQEHQTDSEVRRQIKRLAEHKPRAA